MKHLGDVLLAAVCGLVITTAFFHMNANHSSVPSTQQEQQVTKK